MRVAEAAGPWLRARQRPECDPALVSTPALTADCRLHVLESDARTFTGTEKAL